MKIATQRIEDELLGLTVEFFTVGHGDEPYRIRLTETNGRIVRELRFSSDGLLSGSGTSFEGAPSKAPPKIKLVVK